MGQNPDITIRIQRIERKIYPNITLSVQSQIKENIEFNTITLQ